MIHVMNKRTARKYESPLREDQAEATSERIVEAALRVLERRPGDLSIPATAREARVSVPTVYRHFSDKAALIQAVSDRLDQGAGLRRPGPMHTATDIAEHVRSVFPQLDGRRALLRPAFQSAEGRAVRREHLAERVTMVRGALAAQQDGLTPADHDKLVSIVTILCTSETLGMLQEYLGLSGAEAGETVAWTIERLTKEPNP